MKPGLAKFDTGLVDQHGGLRVVHREHDDVVLADDLIHVVLVDRRGMGDDIDETVVGLELPGRGDDLQRAEVFFEVDGSVQVGSPDNIVVGDTDGADAGRGEVVHKGAADGARTR